MNKTLRVLLANTVLIAAGVAAAGSASAEEVVIIAHERAGGHAPADYLPALQRELVAVISKYVKISDDDIRVSLERQDDLEVLEVKIEIPQAGAPAA